MSNNKAVIFPGGGIIGLNNILPLLNTDFQSTDSRSRYSSQTSRVNIGYVGSSLARDWFLKSATALSDLAFQLHHPARRLIPWPKTLRVR